MAEIKFYDKVEDSKLTFAVIIARMNGRWVLCKHKERTTYELPGGRREPGESIDDTAKRELKEETGATAFSLERICYYSVQGVTREGENLDKETFGALFFAKIHSKKNELHSEMEKAVLLHEMPDNLTYPSDTPKLIDKAWSKILQSENVSVHFPVHDEETERSLQTDTIDIYSKGEYPSDILSNFSPNAFEFDGVSCASMEGFLQSLKYRDPEKQKAVCGLTGKEAKTAGDKKFIWKITGNLYWKGKRYKRKSAEFDELRLNAYKALLGNETFRSALECAKGKPLTHSIGKHNKRATILTVEEFIGYLNKLTEML